MIGNNMTYDEAIGILGNDLWLKDQPTTILDSWLDSTFVHIEKIFGFSTESRNFSDLRSDYRIRKITANENGLILLGKEIGWRAINQITELMNDLEREKQHAKVVKSAQEATKKLDSVLANVASNPIQPKQEIKQVQNPKKMEEKKEHYKIGIGLFWTVVPIIAGAVWYFGYYVGTTKFDREKSDMYDENKGLKKTVKDQSDTIKVLNFRLNESKKFEQRLYQSLPEKQRDSINNLNY